MPADSRTTVTSKIPCEMCSARIDHAHGNPPTNQTYGKLKITVVRYDDGRINSVLQDIRENVASHIHVRSLLLEVEVRNHEPRIRHRTILLIAYHDRPGG